MRGIVAGIGVLLVVGGCGTTGPIGGDDGRYHERATHYAFGLSVMKGNGTWRPEKTPLTDAVKG